MRGNTCFLVFSLLRNATTRSLFATSTSKAKFYTQRVLVVHYHHMVARVLKAALGIG
jgi:hypothetical protein